MFLVRTLVRDLRVAVPGIYPSCMPLHTTTQNCGVKNPKQNQIIKEHSEYYQDHWSTDLEEWSDFNKVVYPPSQPGDLLRPAEIYHGRAFIRFSPKKLWYFTKIVKNMNIDEAIAQLGFLKYKGAKIVSEILLEAQEIAVKEHNVEFKSNLHVATSFVLPAGYRNIVRFHSKGYVHPNKSRFCHYYVKLREGQAPDYEPHSTAYGAAVAYLNGLRMRTIKDGL